MVQLEKDKVLSRLEESFSRESQKSQNGFGRDFRSSLLLKAQPAVAVGLLAQGFIKLDLESLQV